MAIVVGICIFFIKTKHEHIKTEREQISVFTSQNALPVIDNLSLSADFEANSISSLVYRRVALEGRYLAGHDIYLENRVAEDNAKPVSKKMPDFHIMTPFQLRSGAIVWINRDWIGRDSRNRNNIPHITQPDGDQKIHGYISQTKQEIFEMPKDHAHIIDGHVVALNFYLHDDQKGLPSRNVYPFIVMQTGGNIDGLVRPREGYLYQTDYSFELRTWWFTLAIAIGFWLISGIILVRRK